jgi:hypothetical protein
MMSMEQISEDQVATAEVVTRDVELERVEAWRMEELERAGYGPDAATELAQRHDVDLHGAVALIRRGCPPDTAFRILV